MILPRARSTEKQLKLFHADRLFESEGEIRWAVGDAFERITAQVSRAQRLITDTSADVCPDCKWDDSTYFECKGVGKTGKAIFYTGRMTRYTQFFNLGNEIVHWIWYHKFRAFQAKSYDELFEQLVKHSRQVMIVDYQTLNEIKHKVPQTVINSQYNSKRKGVGYQKNEEYGSGWAVPLRFIREACYKIPSIKFMHSPEIEVFVSKQDFGKFLQCQEGV